MVTEPAAPADRQRRRRHRSGDGGRRAAGASTALSQVAAFAVAAGVVVLYALRADGSFDLIARQENGLVIWWIVAVGIALGLLPRRVPGRVAMLAAAALGLFSIWTAVNLLWTVSAGRTTAELARALDYLGLIVLISAVLGRRTWRAAALGWLTGAVAVCALALASRLAPGSFPGRAVGSVFGVSRLSYPFGYWNAVGAWCAMTGALAFGHSCGARRTAVRMVCLAAVPLAAATAYLTYSRAAVAGFAAGAVVCIALSRHRWTAAIQLVVAAGASGAVILAIRAEPAIASGTGTAGAGSVLVAVVGAAVACALAALAARALAVDRWRLPRSLAVVTVAVAAAVAVGAAAVYGPHLASRAWNEFRYPKVVQSANPSARLDSLSGYRYQLWKAALQAFDAHPLHGVGAGTFEFWWNQHATETQYVQNAHSLWLEEMAELGLPGLLAIALFAAAAIGAALSALRRSRRSAAAAACTAAAAAVVVFLVQASVDWMWQSTAVAVLALGAVAIVSVRSSRGRARLRPWARALLAIAAALAGAVQIPGLVSTAAVDASQGAVRAGSGATALAWADEAVRGEPWAAAPYLQRGLVLESFGRFAPARADLQRAVAREPTNFDLWAILSRIDVESGDARAATQAWARSRQLRPYSLLR